MKWLIAIAVLLSLCAPLPVAAQESYPGSTLLPRDVALDLFVQVCTRNVPDFSKSHDVLKKAHFWRRPETGTYFHPEFDLSFKIMPGDGDTCSMVFGSDEKREKLALDFAMVTALSVKSDDDSAEVDFDPESSFARILFEEGWKFQFEPTRSENGVSYYHAYISLQPES